MPMHWKRTYTAIDAHCEGEVGRVMTGGLMDLPGQTILDKFVYLNGDGDWIRKFCVQEPRGGAEKTMNLLLPPTDPETVAGFIPMHGDGGYAMSGSNAMCVATVLLETGMVAMSEPVTAFVLETAAGPVGISARCRNGRCEEVTVTAVPSFVHRLDFPVETEGLGTLTVDVAYGGTYYAFIDAAALGFSLTPDEAGDLVELGSSLKPFIREQVRPDHPADDELNKAGLKVLPFFCLPPGKDRDHYRNTNIIPPARIDRSPCGTGCAARLAVLHARGQAKPGQVVEFRSMIDGVFRTRIVRTLYLGDREAVIPELTGRAWIYGISQIGVDPDDPFPLGYTLSDTWGRTT